MRINLLFKNFTLIVFTALIITSCGNNRNESRATGWGINSKKGGFEYNLEFDDQETGPGLVFIEGGTFTKGQVQDDVMHDWNNAPNKQHVMSFYIDETEVTNLMYLEYLDWINYVFPQENNDYKKLYQGALPDTLVWRNQLGYFEELTSNYLRHPAYAEYPVVGVNWLQAVQFAEWRTDRVNEFILEREAYIEEDVRYNEVDANSTFSTGAYLKRPKTTYRGKKKYPWSGEYTRSEERRSEGDQLANFKLGKGDYGGIAGWSDDGADITIQVKSYPPNDFGVYDMGGNVAEWVADVYRPIVDDEASDFNYYRGNIYLKDVIGEDGKAEVIDPNKLVYDTLPNGKILIKRLPGQLKKQPIDEEETYLRQNFTESDNRNFRDGDVESTLNYSDKSLLARFNGGENEEGGTETESSLMYDAPQNPEVKVVDNKQIRKKDISTKRTSMITDEVRVFKGGSWKDRAYWLDPAQRRYLPQYIATDYIGFRCAMTRLGSKSKAKKTARHKRKG